MQLITLKERLAKLNQLSGELIAEIEAKEVGDVSFAPDPAKLMPYANFDPAKHQLRYEMIDVLDDLSMLIKGPFEHMMDLTAVPPAELSCLNTLNHFNFWDAVPVDGTATQAEIAKTVNLPLEVVRSVLVHATLCRLFERVERTNPDSDIRHNSNSLAMKSFEMVRTNAFMSLDSHAAPQILLNRSLEKYQKGRETLDADVKHTAWAFLHSGGELGDFPNYYVWVDEDGDGERKGWRQKHMVDSMAQINSSLQSSQVFMNIIDWEALGEARIVDIGGSGGHDTVPLAEKYPKLTIEVQDLSACATSFEKNTPEHLKGSRMTFRAHSFFDPQPAKADVFTFKTIFYDWADEGVVNIFKALAPAMTEGTRVIILDAFFHPGNDAVNAMSRNTAKKTTQNDLKEISIFGHTERDNNGLVRCIKEADDRYQVVRNKAVYPYIVIELGWKESA